MTAAKKPKKKTGGPFVAAAVFCNSVTEDSDGVVSALRIVDEIRIAVGPHAPADFPSKDNPVETALFVLIMIRRGDAAPGKHKLRLVVEAPSGKTRELQRVACEMPAHPNGTATIKARVALKLLSAGVFWIDVILGKERLTRMALNLVVQRTDAPESAQS